MENQDYGELIESSAFSLFEIEEKSMQEISLFDDNHSVKVLGGTNQKPILISLVNRDTKYQKY